MCAINIYGFIGIFLFTFAQCESIKVIDSHENEAGAYKPNWESLDKRPLPVWYDDAKFGIFMHWGVYSVPGFGSEWFWSNWKNGDKPVEDYMKSFYPPDYSYQNFGPDFKAEFFNATKWANILHNSGAKYVVLTSKHHEGFTLWPSTKAFSWNAVDIGPHRDIVGELSKAVRKQGLHFGVYYSLYEWFNPMYEADRASNFTQQIYVDNKMLPELKELVTQYKPDVIWTDGDWEAEDKYFRSEEFLAWLYNKSPIKDTVVTNDRWGKDIPCHHGGIYTCTDRYNPQTLQEHKWENCMTVDRKSWGFRKNADIEDIFSIEELIKELVTTVSCGGNLLMNVGPTKEGTIAPIYQERLKSMGKWLDINGEAIFKTSPWLFQNDTLNGDVWYTSAASKPIHGRHRERINSPKTTIYAIVLKWPKKNQLGIASIADMSHRSVTMLGAEDLGPLQWHQDGSTVWIDLPDISMVKSQWAWSLKLTN